MNAGTVIIHCFAPSPVTIDGVSFLSEDELERASRFKFLKDSERWKSYRISLRIILAQSLGISPPNVPLVTGPFGKPTLAPPYDDLHFNLSHCDELAVLALCLDGPVGIDVESIRRAPDLLECIETFCHPAEIETLPLDPHFRASSLLELWCAKEALLKSLGTGFSQAPEKVRLHSATGSFTLDPETPLDGADRQRTTLIRHDQLENHRIALSAPLSTTLVEIILQSGSTPNT